MPLIISATRVQTGAPTDSGEERETITPGRITRPHAAGIQDPLKNPSVAEPPAQVGRHEDHDLSLTLDTTLI
jgi:hypothetical protein